MTFIENEEDILLDNRQIPVTKELKCKILAYIIGYSLTLSPFLISIYVWFKYDFLIGIGMGLFAYIVSMVIASKLRLYSIPINQIEVSHSNLDIAKWYVFMRVC